MNINRKISDYSRIKISFILAGLKNPKTNQRIFVLETVEKLLSEGIDIKLPKDIVFNTFTKKLLILDDVTKEKIRRNKNIDLYRGKIVRTDFDILEEFREKLRNNPGKKILVKYNNGTKAITLTENNINQFNMYEELPSNNSFRQSIIEIRNLGDIEFEEIEETRSRPVGGFFPYLVPFEGLEKYGIYTEYKSENYNDNCLIKSFIESGLFNETELTRVKDFCRNGIIPRISLNKIAELLDVQIKLQYHKKNSKKIYNKKSEKIIEIGCLEDHYFLNDKTEFTRYSIKNYEKVKHKKDWNYLIRSHNYDKEKVLNAFNIINEILNQDYKVKINKGIGDIIYSKEEEVISAPLDISKKDYREIEYKPKEIKERPIAFFDFESCPFDEHKPFLVNLRIGNKSISFEGFNCVNQFLNFIKNNKLNNYIFYAHNLRYDFGFIFNEEGFRTKNNVIKTGNSFKSVCGYFYGFHMEFKDTFSLIPIPLSKFGEAFNLEIEKDVFPYKVCTKENIQKQIITIKECLKHLKENEHEQFINNCKKISKNENVKKINIIEYAKYYCKKDTKVLEQGFNIFREQIKELCDIDIIHCISIPQIVNIYFKKKGVFDGCYEYSGQIRQYFQKCVKGGRCMLKNNEPQDVEEPIEDFDGVSLYPSAMNRINGFEKGIPKILKIKTKEFLDKCTNYYIRINITKVGKKLNFPLISIIDENGTRQYVNQKCNNYYCSKIEFEDLIEFQKIEYEIIDGLYFNEGYNSKINQIIEYLFQYRLELKKSKNPLQNTIKLLMNSGYGKLLLKPIDIKYEFCYSKSDYLTKLNYNYNFIKDITYYNNCKVLKIFKPFNKQFNSSNLGSSILAMSKRIMNEVMILCDDDCYYTDTDSIHIKKDKIEQLENKYNKKYKRELVGNQLGQFHTDFQKINNKATYSKRFIGLGKKCYLDILTNGEDVDYHIRMKGIPEKCIRDNKIPILEQYLKLKSGECITYDLLEGCLGFDSSGFGIISNKKSFNRDVKFDFK